MTNSASLREAHQNGRPISYFRQWPLEYLIEAGLPQDWLEKCGLVKTDGTPSNLPNQCSQRRFAEIVTKLFGKVVNQAAISRAVRFEGLNVAVTPSNGRLKTDAALQWWRVNKTASVEDVTTEAEHRRERQRIAREREQIELDEMKRRASDAWTLTSVYLKEMTVAGDAVRNSVYHAIEIQLKSAVESEVKNSITEPALQQALIEKLRPIYPAQFEAWQKDFCSRMDQLIADGAFENRLEKSKL